MTALTIVILMAALALLAGVGGYVWLSERSGALDQVVAKLDLLLKHRQDLASELVEAVRRGSPGAEEAGAIEPLIAARNAAAMAVAVPDRAVAEAALGEEISRLLAGCESCEGLAATPRFVGLREEIAAIEIELGQAVAAADTTVAAYNRAIGGFPASLIAGPLGFRRRPPS